MAEHQGRYGVLQVLADAGDTLAPAVHISISEADGEWLDADEARRLAQAIDAAAAQVDADTLTWTPPDDEAGKH